MLKIRRPISIQEGHWTEMSEHPAGTEPSRLIAGDVKQPQNRSEHDIDEWTGGDTPKSGTGTRGRIHVGDTAERPEDNLVGLTTDLAASQCVAELVNADDQEKREIFEDVPEERRISF